MGLMMSKYWKIGTAALLALMMILFFGKPAKAITYGWSWGNKTVYVYVQVDSPDSNWQIAEAASEWRKGGIDLQMTSDPTGKANLIVVKEVAYLSSPGSCDIGCVRIGVAYLPPRTNNVASGICTIELLHAYRTTGMAEHVAIHEMGHCIGLNHTTNKRSVMRDSVSSTDYFTRPQSYDYRDMRSLY